jgi:hypothetical protein
MKKIWSYIAMFALGLAAGIVAGVKLMGDQIEINIKKVKNKRTSGDNSVTVPIDLRNAEDDAKAKRAERKQRRLNRKKRKDG